MDGNRNGKDTIGNSSNNSNNSSTKSKKTNGQVPLTARSLLDLCNFKRNEGEEETDEESRRLRQLQQWHQCQPEKLARFLVEAADVKSGCYALHWAAGTGFDQAVAFLLDHYHHPEELSVNQLALKPSTGRTPLHYAARNGHLSTSQLLIETYKADPNPKCHKGSVSPMQLAVWQNQLAIVQYLAQANQNSGNPNILLERNDFNCGLQHWIGLIPKHRWLDSINDDNNTNNQSTLCGSGVLPLANYMHEQGGLSYSSTPDNQQNQGHTPLHKAAWGGNVALLQYFCQEHGVYDNVQDASGNYAADLALMGGNTEAHAWLLRHGSRARCESLQVLGFSGEEVITNDEIYARYKVLARKFHPDKLTRDKNMNFGHDKNNDELFMQVKAAYEHLIHHGGVGSQRNPKYEALKMLTQQTTNSSKRENGKEETTSTEDCSLNEDQLFQARILAVISDYGDKGFPICSIARRWNQIWPDQPFPSPVDYIIQVPVVVKQGKKDGSNKILVDNGNEAPATETAIQPLETTMVPKRVRLLKFLKWKCGQVVMFRKIDGVELAFQKTRLPEQYKALTNGSLPTDG
ncbi:Ankyrin Repeat [Seminavis robusta]|uniref:Ankyrin Repeat n=1 Tax=Seminavis robusta TaxID=568900 RepID=A0A9N8EM99_9STRA|nr:Ankyrin Repeat [Seminavis robusta]|eukprot:Sro1247_g255930.1 Ankyrin Repeat (575) ;mRNA; r:28876-30600